MSEYLFYVIVGGLFGGTVAFIFGWEQAKRKYEGDAKLRIDALEQRVRELRERQANNPSSL